MKKQTEKQLAALSEAVGDFIRYWGFRRIHGQIWTQVYLSKEPLSGAELTKRLKVSKALVSPALKELEDYKLIQVKKTDNKTKKYLANPEVFEVIRDILKKREMDLIEKALVHFGKIETSDDPGLDQERIRMIGQMISVAHFALGFIVSQVEEKRLTDWVTKSSL